MVKQIFSPSILPLQPYNTYSVAPYVNILWFAQIFGDGNFFFSFLTNLNFSPPKNVCFHFFRPLYGGHLGISKWPPFCLFYAYKSNYGLLSKVNLSPFYP